MLSNILQSRNSPVNVVALPSAPVHAVTQAAMKPGRSVSGRSSTSSSDPWHRLGWIGYRMIGCFVCTCRATHIAGLFLGWSGLLVGPLGVLFGFWGRWQAFTITWAVGSCGWHIATRRVGVTSSTEDLHELQGEFWIGTQGHRNLILTGIVNQLHTNPSIGAVCAEVHTLCSPVSRLRCVTQRRSRW